MKTSTPNMDQALPSREQLELLLSGHKLSTAFQPIVSMESAEVTGFEALARPFPETGIPNAGVLFDAAEHHRLLWELEEITRAAALQLSEDFPNGTLLFTNSTPEVFVDDRFVPSVEAAVRAIPGLTPSRVVLEVTERSGGDDLEKVARQVEKLKQLGFQIAIDDVGAGTSGLTRIMMLRPHWLKLDRELISGIDHNRYKLNLIRFLVNFARLSGVNVIAEGIEREEELATLISLGVKYVQGFYLGRPASGYQQLRPELTAWIRTRWAQYESARCDDPRGAALATLCQPIESVQMTAPLRELALRSLKDPACLGYAVLDGTRLVGWCSRQTVLDSARRSDSRLPVGFISSADLGTLPPHATVGEGLELLTTRQDACLADPLIVAERDEIVGVVTLRRLLEAVAGEGRMWLGASTTLTGLPGPVAAEKRIRTLIQAGSAGVDCAIVDIRFFAEFNNACGYEAGDRLIQEVAALMRTHLSAGDEHTFMAHLGDDRFFITGGHGRLRTRLEGMMDAFAGIAMGASGWSTVGAGPASAACQAAASRLGLRGVVMANAFATSASPRALYDLYGSIRQSMRSTLERQRVSGSVLVEDRQVQHLRAAG